MPRSQTLAGPPSRPRRGRAAFLSAVLLALWACGDDAPAAEAEEGSAPANTATAESPEGPEATGGEDPSTTGEDAQPEVEPPVPPLTKSSLREHPAGKAWLFDAPAGDEPRPEPRQMENPRAEARGYTLVSLGDDWVPYIFTEQTPGLEDPQPNDYAQRFRDLANDRVDADGDPLPAGSHNYLELYGIPPSLSVVYDEWVRVESTVTPCLEKAGYDPQVFVDLPFDHISYGKKDGPRRLSRLRSAKSQLDKAIKEAKLPAGELEAAKDHPETKRAWERWHELDREVAVIRNAQIRLRCERMFDTNDGRGKFKAGDFDSATTHALAAFEKKHDVRGWGHFNPDNLAVFAQTAQQSVHARLLRVITERVANGAGILEDGSAAQWKPDFRYKDAQGQEHALGDELGDSLEATVAALDIATPERARASMEKWRELAGGNFEQLLVAVKLPARPAYYAEDMDFEAVIDRGDVWYEFPYDEEGNRKSQPRSRYPHLTLYVNYEGQRIPIVHWRTTIGSWRSEMHEGNEWFAYKNSDVGPRVWKDIMAAPAWIPPASTPTRSLTKRKSVNGRYKRVVNYDETGPGYQSAYGLVAAYHIKQVTRRDGTVVELDNQIRTHGSVDYMSIMRRYSHGCHRLYNMNAVRMFSFILQHRDYQRHGQHEIGYRRAFDYDGEPYHMAIDTRGYRYELTTPIPVEVLEGRVRGSVGSPIEEMMPKPGVDYGPPPDAEATEGELGELPAGFGPPPGAGGTPIGRIKDTPLMPPRLGGSPPGAATGKPGQ